jgi:hypothetical protein
MLRFWTQHLIRLFCQSVSPKKVNAFCCKHSLQLTKYMGTYTAFVFNAQILPELLADEDSGDFRIILDEALRGFDQRSCYFPSALQGSVFKATPTELYEVENTISICCSIKNYNNEIQDFVKWISPYLYKNSTHPTHQCLGYFQELENDSPPEFIFLR